MKSFRFFSIAIVLGLFLSVAPKSYSSDWSGGKKFWGKVVAGVVIVGTGAWLAKKYMDAQKEKEKKYAHYYDRPKLSFLDGERFLPQQHNAHFDAHLEMVETKEKNPFRAYLSIIKRSLEKDKLFGEQSGYKNNDRLLRELYIIYHKDNKNREGMVIEILGMIFDSNGLLRDKYKKYKLNNRKYFENEVKKYEKWQEDNRPPAE